MFGEFSGEHEADGSLDFPRGKSCLLVVGREFSGLGCDPLEDVIDKRVHDGHSLLGNPGIGVDLLEDLVDVRRVRFNSLLLFLPSGGSGLLGRGGSLLGGLLGGCLGHGGKCIKKEGVGKKVSDLGCFVTVAILRIVSKTSQSYHSLQK